MSALAASCKTQHSQSAAAGLHTLHHRSRLSRSEAAGCGGEQASPAGAVTCLANSGSFFVSSLWKRTFSRTSTCQRVQLSPQVPHGGSCALPSQPGHPGRYPNMPHVRGMWLKLGAVSHWVVSCVRLSGAQSSQLCQQGPAAPPHLAILHLAGLLLDGITDAVVGLEHGGAQQL